MALLGIDIGSSSVKCALLDGARVVGRQVTRGFETRFIGVRAEVDPDAVLRAVTAAVGELGPRARRAEAIALSTMSPSWVAMDARGRALTPIVTHQDRRSVEIALALERAIGAQRHLRLVGNRPFPGGISSTTAAWFARHARPLMQRADLIGHLPTFLHRQLTGARIVDPSHASFMGLYDVVGARGWVSEVCEAACVQPAWLPEIIPADAIGGRLTATAAGRLGLSDGMPMLTGLVDGSAGALLSGLKPGQLINVSGSTDVLALVTDDPQPDSRLLTRAVGVGRRWLSVSTLAAAGSALDWARRELFADLPWPAFARLVRKAAVTTGAAVPTFTPYLGGDRMSVEQQTARIDGLTLATTRQDLLAALVHGLAQASAARLEHLAINRVRPRREIFLTGGATRILGQILHRDWPGRWTFRHEKEATLRGLGCLTPRKRP